MFLNYKHESFLVFEKIEIFDFFPAKLMDRLYYLKRIKIDFEETSYFSNVRKNDQQQFHIFGKDFSVKKSWKKN